MTEQSPNTDIAILASYWTLAGDVYPGGLTEVSPWSFKERVEAAVAAGYQGIGFNLPDLLANKEKLGLKEMKRILDANGISIVEIELLTGWDATTEPEKKQAAAVRDNLFDIATELGAVNIKTSGSFNKQQNNADLPHLIDTLGELTRYAEQIGVNIALELMPITNITTLDYGLDIVKSINSKYGGLLLDIWHIQRTGISYEDVSNVPLQFLKSVELADAAAKPQYPLPEDAINHRKLCGEGDFDIPGFIKAIQRTGYAGHFGVEIEAISFRKLPLDEMARKSFDTTIAKFK